MRKLLIIAGALVVLLFASGLGYRAWRGPIGSAGLPATSVPEFGSLDAARWAIAAPAPLAAAKGEVVFVEGWSPG